MPVRAVRLGCIVAVLLIVNICSKAPGSSAENQIIDSLPTTSSAVYFQFQPGNYSETYLCKFLSPSEKVPFKTALSFYHPMVQWCEYSHQFAGPTGEIILPGNRRLRTDMFFLLKLSGEERFLLPDSKARIYVYVRPGSIQEKWVWPDGLVITRICFQTPQQVGAGIRFLIQNQGNTPMNGVRLATILNNPEITGNEKRRSKPENDDAMMADLRTAVLYQQDYLVREESWLGMGWSEEGGLITSGESSSLDMLLSQPTRQNILPEKIISLETPARDLLPGQTDESTFWITWGGEQDAISKSFVRLRKVRDYQAWEETTRKNVEAGVTFTSQDKYLSFLFQVLKAWTPWMVHKDIYEHVYFSSLINASAITPERVLFGIDGLIAFGKRREIKNYLDFWMDERSESISVVYTVQLAYRYFLLTQDRKWLLDNTLRIKELAYHLLEMDQNQDGLPEYNWYEDDFPIQDIQAKLRRKTQFLNNSIAGIQAFSDIGNLLKIMGDEESKELAKKCKNKIPYGGKSIETKFWHPFNDKPGYYSAVFFPPEGKIPYKSLDGVEVTLRHLEIPWHQEEFFEDIWTNREWLNHAGYYRQYINMDPTYSGIVLLDQRKIDFAESQAIFLAGILNPQVSSDAVGRLSHYAQQVVVDPAIMAMIGQNTNGIAVVDVSALNLIEVITRGLCGLEPVSDGLKVTIPTYSQDLDIRIRDLPFRHTFLDIAVFGKGEGNSQILVNGKKIQNGSIISNENLNNVKTVIRIQRNLE